MWQIKFKKRKKMTIASENSVVELIYSLTEAGSSEVIDSNDNTNPLEFITGKGRLIIGLERALAGMNEGDSADVMVKAEEAYGEYNPEALQTIPADQFTGIDLKEGMTLYGQGEHGQTVQVTVKSFDSESVVIDHNHPLAGKDLMFSVTVASVREATADEAMSGEVAYEASSCGTGNSGGGCCGGGHCH